MNTYQYPNNEWNTFTRILSIMFIVSLVLMVGGYLFETITFENKSAFDKPLKVNAGFEDKFLPQYATIGKPTSSFGE